MLCRQYEHDGEREGLRFWRSSEEEIIVMWTVGFWGRGMGMEKEKTMGRIDPWWSGSVGRLASRKESRWTEGREVGMDACFLFGTYSQTECRSDLS